MSAISDNFATRRFIYRKLPGGPGTLLFLLLLLLPVGIWGALRISMTMAARRAGILLTRIKDLRVRESTFQDAELLAEQYPGQVEYDGGDCESSKCAYHIDLAHGLMYQPGLLHESLRSLGIRSFLVGGFVEVRDGHVMGTEFMVDTEAKRGVPGGQWLVVVARIADHFPNGDYYHGRLQGLDEHPNREVIKPHLTTGGGGQTIRSAVTADATTIERERAFDFRLSCLSSLKGCARLSDILPSAWEDLLAMRKLQSGITVENSDQYCPVRTLARLSRDMENVLVVEIRRVFPSDGEWDGTQDVKFRLVEILKGKTSPHLARYPMELVKGSPIADRRGPRLDPEIFSVGKQIVLFLRESEIDFIPDPYCEVIPASRENLAVVRQSITQLKQGLPIAALK